MRRVGSLTSTPTDKTDNYDYRDVVQYIFRISPKEYHGQYCKKFIVYFCVGGQAQADSARQISQVKVELLC